MVEKHAIDRLPPWFAYGARGNLKRVAFITIVFISGFHLIIPIQLLLSDDNSLGAAEARYLLPMAFFLIALISVNYLVFVYFIRSCLIDLNNISPDATNESTMILPIYVQVLLGLILGFVGTVVSTAELQGITISRSFVLLMGSIGPSHPIVIILLDVCLIGVLAVSMYVTVYDVLSKPINSAARSTDINLLVLHELSRYSNPMIRMATYGIIGLAVLLATYPSPGIWPFVLEKMLPLHLLFICTLGAPTLAAPIILQRRIEEERNRELEIVSRVLKGDQETLANTGLAQLQKLFPGTDLLSYQQRLLDLWTFPIEEHTRRLVLLGIVAPLTWVLAAIVENTLYKSFQTSRLKKAASSRLHLVGSRLFKG